MKKLFLVLVMLFFSVTVNAAQQWCTGTISHTYLTSTGELVIRGTWRNQHTMVCSLESEWKGVSTETCKGWLSLAVAAKISEANVIVYYSDVPSCTEIAAYGSAPNPGYIMLDR